MINHNNDEFNINFIKNKHQFTNRQIDIIACMICGKFSNKTIAQTLNISPKTVDSHIQMIMKKLHVSDRENIIEFAQTSGYEKILKAHYITIMNITEKKKHKSKFTIPIFIFLCLIMILFLKQTFFSKVFIHNIALHPNEQEFLERPHIIYKMHKTLIDQKQPIKIIALNGIGGAGKTTLARQYAKKYYSKLLSWEINAETQETMSNSFFELGNELAKTTKEKNELIYIKNINDPKKQFLLILQFIQIKLQHLKNWLLIYDNIESWTNLPPHNNWGQGQIILTTRNTNLIAIKDTIVVDSLNNDEMYTLFTKIAPMLSPQKQDLISFLKKLPPFPFDIVTAAYYIKITKISYSEFINQLKKHNPDFETSLLTIRKSINNYVHTRHGILKLKFKNILHENPEFKELLCIIGLFDSQYIPKEFLNHYKKSTIVDLFIYTMKNHSLITTHEQKSISVHRSIQEHLIKFLIEETGNILPNIYSSIIQSLDDYLKILFQKVNTSTMHILLPHLLSISKHASSFINQDTLILNLLLGKIYFYLGDYLNAKKYLEKSLEKTNNINIKLPHLPQILSYLGGVMKEIGEYSLAKKYLEKSLSLYEKHFPNLKNEKAWTLLQLGDYFTYMGDYKASQISLEQSIKIYMEDQENYKVQLIWAWVYLGDVYGDLADYCAAQNAYTNGLLLCKQSYGPQHTKTIWLTFRTGTIYKRLGQYKKAQTFLEKSLKTYKDELSTEKDRCGWNAVHLGGLYLTMGLNDLGYQLIRFGLNLRIDYYGRDHIHTQWDWVHFAQCQMLFGYFDKAIHILEKSLKAHEKCYGNNHKKIAWICHHLGNAYKLSNNYEKALQYYKRSLTINQEKYGNDHLETALVMTDFGDFYRYIHEFENSKNMLNHALSIFEKHNHPEAYKCLEHLGDLYIQQPQQARIFWLKALKITTNNFPKKSNHIHRLKKKLSTIKI